MTGNAAAAPLVGGVGLLERAIGYTLGSLQLVTPAALARPSPCAGWDLADLLSHMNESLAALHQAGDSGRVDRTASRDFGDPGRDPVATLRNRACSMLGSWAGAEDRAWVTVGGRPITGGLVTATGALEIAVHGWDVAQAVGSGLRLPEDLAARLYGVAQVVVSPSERGTRFADAVPVAPSAPMSTRLLAHLGRVA